MSTLFHVTTADTASAILREGFREEGGSYMTDREFSGVWLSDRPLDANDGARGDSRIDGHLFDPAHDAGRL
jgi:hypothetical protein